MEKMEKSETWNQMWTWKVDFDIYLGWLFPNILILWIESSIGRPYDKENLLGSEASFRGHTVSCMPVSLLTLINPD